MGSCAHCNEQLSCGRLASMKLTLPLATPSPQVPARLLLEMARQALTMPGADSGMRKDLKQLLDKLSARASQYRLAAEPLTPEEIGELMAE